MASAAITMIGESVVDIVDVNYDQWYFIPDEWERRVYYEETVGYDKRDFIGYESTVGKIRSRLHLAGYDERSLEQDFERTKATWIEELKSIIEFHEKNFKFKKKDSVSSLIITDTERCLNVIRGIGFEEWRETFYETMKTESCNKTPNKNLVNYNLVNLIESDSNIFNASTSSGYSGGVFPCMQKESFALLLLDMYSDNEFCTLDLTQLVRDGHVRDIHEVNKDVGINHLDSKYFRNIMTSLHELNAINYENSNAIIQRMIFSNVITAMEAYLSDTIKRNIFSRPEIKRNFIEKSGLFDKNMKENKFYEFMLGLDKRINDEIDAISFHTIHKARDLYLAVLDYSMDPDDVEVIRVYVTKRNDIVHRNGYDKDGILHVITQEDVEELIDKVLSFTYAIDREILKISLYKKQS